MTTDQVALFVIEQKSIVHAEYPQMSEEHIKDEVMMRLARRVASLEATLRNPPKHDYWMAGEKDCPQDIKAGNGEIHTLRCKRCGLDSPRDQICRAA